MHLTFTVTALTRRGEECAGARVLTVPETTTGETPKWPMQYQQAIKAARRRDVPAHGKNLPPAFPLGASTVSSSMSSVALEERRRVRPSQ